MHYPLVSVIIPTYNRKESVKEAVQSVLDQDYPKIEVVVIDDGSTDGTAEELAKVFGSRIHYVFQENAGVSRARNRGVLEARGDLVCFLDSDDILVPGSISARISCFSNNKNCRVSYGLSVKETKYAKKKEALLKKSFPYGYIMKSYLKEPFCNTNTYMISKEDMLNYGMYREDLTNLEDFELFVRLMHKLYFCYCGTICSLTRDKSKSAHRNFKKIMDQGIKALDHIFSDPELVNVLAEEKIGLYAETYLRLAKASLKLKRGREFRRYFKMARELQHSQRTNFKFWRRWIISWAISLWQVGKE
jgi:glycosyltransferase involved in cell wall biosynthesis